MADNRITFSAQMDGLDKVVDMLNKASQQLSGMGENGSKGIQAMNKAMDDFNSKIKMLQDTRSGLGGVTKAFDELSQKANETVAKSHLASVDTLKNEVKGIEEYIRSARTSVGQAQRDLDELRRKQKDMAQDDFLAKEKTLVNQINHGQMSAAMATAQMNRANTMAWMQSPVHQGAFNFASRYGMGEYLTNGSLLQRGPGLLMGAMAAPGQYFDLMDRWGQANIHSRSLVSVNEMLAGRMLHQQQSAAMSGDITAAALSNLGLGVTANELGSDDFNSTVRNRTWRQSVLGRGLMGAASGGAMTALGLGLMGTGIGILPGALIAGAGMLVGGGIGALTSKPSTTATEAARYQAELTERDREAYGLVFGGAGKNFFEESNLTTMQQRMYGIGSSHGNVASLLGQGVASLSDLAPMMALMNARGRMMGNAGFGVFGQRFGASSQLSMSQMARLASIRGEGTTIADMMSGFAGAGMFGSDTIPMRGMLSDYGSGILANRGQGATSFAEATAGVGAIISSSGGVADLAERTGTSISLAQNFQAQAMNGQSLTGTMMRQALVSLGIVDPRVQSVLIQQGLDNPKTRQSIVRMSGGKLTLDDVNRVLSGASGTISAAVGATWTDTAKAQMQIAGVDIEAYGAGGLSLGEGASAAGLTAGGARTAALTSGVSDFGSVVEGGMGFKDQQSAREAQTAAVLERSMKEIAERANQDIIQVISDAVIKGFNSMNTSIAEATQNVMNKDAAKTPAGTFTGTKRKDQ